MTQVRYLAAVTSGKRLYYQHTFAISGETLQYKQVKLSEDPGSTGETSPEPGLHRVLCEGHGAGDQHSPNGGRNKKQYAGS